MKTHLPLLHGLRGDRRALAAGVAEMGGIIDKCH
jgi:hypothetical protein